MPCIVQFAKTGLCGLCAKIGAQILIGQLFRFSQARFNVLHFRKQLENTVERRYLYNVNLGNALALFCLH